MTKLDEQLKEILDNFIEEIALADEDLGPLDRIKLVDQIIQDSTQSIKQFLLSALPEEKPGAGNIGSTHSYAKGFNECLKIVQDLLK